MPSCAESEGEGELSATSHLSLTLGCRCVMTTHLLLLLPSLPTTVDCSHSNHEPRISPSFPSLALCSVFYQSSKKSNQYTRLLSQPRRKTGRRPLMPQSLEPFAFFIFSSWDCWPDTFSASVKSGEALTAEDHVGPLE